MATMAEANTSSPSSTIEDSRLDNPLPAVRAPRSEVTTDDIDLGVDALETPLVQLRAPTEVDGRLIFSSRSNSPTGTEIVDGADDELEYIEGSEDKRPDATEFTVSNNEGDTPTSSSSKTPVSSVENEISYDKEAATVPPATSSRSMRHQTMRSFEARTTADKSSEPSPKKVAPAKAAGAKKPKGTSTLAARSLSSLSIGEPAPGDAELYKLSNLMPPTTKEPAADQRRRMDENSRRMVMWVLTLQKSVEDTEKAQKAQSLEILQRLADVQLSTSGASSSLSVTTATDIARLKQLIAEGREATSKLTECVNNLVDIPAEIAALRRAVRDLSSRASVSHDPAPGPTRAVAPSSRPDSGSQSVRDRGSTNSGATSGVKRSRAFSPVREPASKHHKSGEIEAEFVFDVYLWDVKLNFGSPTLIAREALEAVKMANNPAFRSAVHPNGLPKTLISLRFTDAPVAQTFMDRIRTNPPKGMEHLNVSTPTSYGKRREGGGHAGNNGRKAAEKPW